MTDQEIERIATKHIRWIKPEHGIFYDAEVLDFARAILAAQLAAPGAPTDQQIVDTLARHGIGWGDEQGVTAYPLDGEDAPIYIAAVRELLAAPGAPAPKKADFFCFPAGTYAIDKPAPGERQPCFHTNTVTQKTGDGTPVEFCRDCGTNRA